MKRKTKKINKKNNKTLSNLEKEREVKNSFVLGKTQATREKIESNGLKEILESFLLKKD